MANKKVGSDLVTICNKYDLTMPQRKGIECILSTPPGSSKQDVAKAAGVTYKTLWTWFRQKRFLDALAESANLIVDGAWADILRTGIEMAMGGDIQWARWLGEVTGRYNPKATLEHTGEVKTISDILDSWVNNGRPDEPTRRRRLAGITADGLGGRN